jgi:hypothetical protein
MSKKIGINKLMAKRKSQAKERISLFPNNMTIADFDNYVGSMSIDDALDKMFGAHDEQLTSEDLLSPDIPEEFLEAYHQQVAEYGADKVWATRKANGDLSIRMIMED